jgi:formate hydrogenlyase subunit 4
LAIILANVFLPFGMARIDGAGGYAVGAALVVLKVTIVGLALAVLESSFAKRRFFELPDLVGAAGFAAIVGIAVTVLFP